MSPAPSGGWLRSQGLQERSRRTRDRLVTTAFVLFSERGYDEVTVDDICAEVGVAKGTYYFHFPSKKDLLVAAFHRGGPDIRAYADELVAAEVPFADAVFALGDRIARNTERLPKALVHRATVESLAVIGADDPEAERRHRRDGLLTLVNAGRAASEVREGLHLAEVAMALNWAMIQALLVWSSGDGARPTLVEVTRRRLTLALHGAVVPV